MIAVISSLKSYRYFKKFVLNREDEHKFFNVSSLEDIRNRNVTQVIRMHGSGSLRDYHDIINYCKAMGFDV